MKKWGTSRTLVLNNVSENRTYVANYKEIKYTIYEAEDFMNLQSEKKDENGARFKKLAITLLNRKNLLMSISPVVMQLKCIRNLQLLQFRLLLKGK